MEKGREAALASERYGSAGCWNYFTNDGVIERRREEGEGKVRGENAIVRVFKVRTARLHAWCGQRRKMDGWVGYGWMRDGWLKNPTCFKSSFQSVFLPQGYPDSVSPDYLQYQFWDTVQVSWILPNCPHQMETLLLTLLSGFFQHAVGDFGHSGFPQRRRCGKPGGNGCCSHDDVVIKRWSFKMGSRFLWCRRVNCGFLLQMEPACSEESSLHGGKGEYIFQEMPINVLKWVQLMRFCLYFQD